jgi:hypothetical protein
VICEMKCESTTEARGREVEKVRNAGRKRVAKRVVRRRKDIVG